MGGDSEVQTTSLQMEAFRHHLLVLVAEDDRVEGDGKQFSNADGTSREIDEGQAVSITAFE